MLENAYMTNVSRIKNFGESDYIQQMLKTIAVLYTKYDRYGYPQIFSIVTYYFIHLKLYKNFKIFVGIQV